VKQTLQSSLWSHRDIRLVLPARALSYAGDSIALIALMLRVEHQAGPGMMTMLLLAFAVPTVLMTPFAGRIVDGYDSRKVLVCASLLQAAAGVGIAFSEGLAATFALVAVLQVGQAVAGPAWGALIPRIVGEGLVGRATGASQALIGVATMAGSAAGGLLVGWSGDRGALLVDAATFLALAVVACLVRTRRSPARGAVREPGALMAGLRSIFDDSLLRILVPALWLFVLVGEGVNVVEVYLVTRELGLSAGGYGAIGAATGAGAIAGAWYSGRLKDDGRRSGAVLVGMAGIGVACVVMGLARNVPMLAVGAVVIGIGMGLLNSAVSTLLVTRSAERVRGRVIAALSGTIRSFSLIALLLGGAIGTLLGPRGTFVSFGVLATLAAVVTAALVLRTLRRSRGPAQELDSVAEVVSH
jgi:MFS family permease